MTNCTCDGWCDGLCLEEEMTNDEDMLKLFSDFCKQPAGDSGLEIGDYLDEDFMFALFCEIYRFAASNIRDQEAGKRTQLEEQIARLVEEAYMRGRQHLMSELLESKPETPSYENIKDILPSMLQGGFKCPLCRKDSPHEHSPIEIIIYRNGVKYGRWIETSEKERSEK